MSVPGTRPKAIREAECCREQLARLGAAERAITEPIETHDLAGNRRVDLAPGLGRHTRDRPETFGSVDAARTARPFEANRHATRMLTQHPGCPLCSTYSFRCVSSTICASSIQTICVSAS